jgi:hypothetical protein
VRNDMSVDGKKQHWQKVGSLATIAVFGVVVFGCTRTPVWAQGNQRPLSDFLNAQGSTQCFTPPAPAQLAGATGVNADGDVKTNGQAGLTPPRFALVDYTGLEAKYLKVISGIDLGTTVSGTVMERPLANGSALVTVDLQTKNALGWAIQNQIVDINTEPLVFGARVLDVAAGKTPALGDVHFRIVFTNTAPGAPLPDVVCINHDFGCPEVKPCPNLELDTLQLDASITGPLHATSSTNWPEGTLGKMIETQTGLIQTANKNGFKGPLSDLFPVESIRLNPIGH